MKDSLKTHHNLYLTQGFFFLVIHESGNELLTDNLEDFKTSNFVQTKKI